jgi:hypothetical protein
MQPRDLLDYLSSVADKLGELGGTFTRGPLVEIDDSQKTGVLEVELTFATGHTFSATLFTAGPDNFPDWIAYKFHLMDADERTVFRYDNTRYHPVGPHYPQHKHEGSRVVDAARPSLAAIIDEVRSIVYREPPI